MSSLRHPCIALLYCSVGVAFSLTLVGQTVTPQGGEIPLIESAAVRGDQMLPHVSVGPSGGYVVWEDNAIDGVGFGIGARWLDSSLGPGVFGAFRVNQQNIGSQERPGVANLGNGAAAFVWQGGIPSAQNIYLRFLAPNRTFMTPTDLRVNVYTNAPQSRPVIAALGNNKVAVAWCSDRQDGSMQGVFARIVNTNGQFATSPFQVNQFTNWNQRAPAIAVLSNGNFVVAWVSEQQQSIGTADGMARIFNGSGQPVTDEFRINTSSSICATPAIAKLGSGGFTVAWAQKMGPDTDSWDIYARKFIADGTAAGIAFRVNEYVFGDQFAPSISSLSNNQLVAWTSLAQDGSMEGVYGRLVYDGVPSGSEFLVNTTVNNKQAFPVVASDGDTRFVVSWAGFVGVTNGFDLFEQRYAAGQPLPVPAAPFVAALRFNQLSVTWPTLSGYPLSHYEIYMDAAAPPTPTATVASGNLWVKTGLDSASTHTFRIAYVFSGGTRSQLSPSATGRTWSDDNYGKDGIPDGLPDDWQTTYWGTKPGAWPSPAIDSDGDGASNYQEYLAGTNPRDSNSVLRTWATASRFGRRLNWNTQPGFVYQVQNSADITSSWMNFGAARFAAGATDSLAVPGAAMAEYYRVLRVR